MEELINEEKIVKTGFKPETSMSYKKDKVRYLLCGSCSRWTQTRNQIERDSKVLKVPCAWCAHTIILTIK